MQEELDSVLNHFFGLCAPLLAFEEARFYPLDRFVWAFDCSCTCGRIGLKNNNGYHESLEERSPSEYYRT